MTRPERTRAAAIKAINRTRCTQTDSPLGPLQRCQRDAGHDGDHDYGNAAVRT